MHAVRSPRLQQLGHGEVRVRNQAGTVSAHAAMAGVQPGHQHATRRRADRAARIVPRESHPFAAMRSMSGCRSVFCP